MLVMTSSPDTSDTDTGVELTENNDGCVQADREHPIAEDTDQISSYWTKNCCSGLLLEDLETSLTSSVQQRLQGQ